jgi:hypothetical protein
LVVVIFLVVPIATTLVNQVKMRAYIGVAAILLLASTGHYAQAIDLNVGDACKKEHNSLGDIPILTTRSIHKVCSEQDGFRTDEVLHWQYHQYP